MKEAYSAGRTSASSLRDLIVRFSVPLEFETLLFAVVSSLDLLFTWQLLTHETETSAFAFVESNPLAEYFLCGWGFSGLAFFKFSLVGVVAVVCQVIARRKIDVARRLLRFGTLAVFAVVAYSATLLIQHT
ncbi:MAG: DUF5658 family protein [Planctomycetaceae bacterium]